LRIRPYSLNRGRSSAVDESEDIDQRYETRLGDVEYDAKFVFDEIGYNFLPLEASAAFGREQLKRLDDFTAQRRENFEAYHDFFGQYEEYFIVPEERAEVTTPWLAFPLTVTEDAPFNRPEIVKHLEKHNVQTRSAWTGNILRHPGFEDIDCRCPLDEYENADYIMENAFVIGCHQSMGQPEREYVQSVCEEFFAEVV